MKTFGALTVQNVPFTYIYSHFSTFLLTVCFAYRCHLFVFFDSTTTRLYDDASSIDR